METDLLFNVRGNGQAQKQEKRLRPTSIPPCAHCEQQQKSLKDINNSTPTEEAKAVFNVLDTIFDNSTHKSPIGSNHEINVFGSNSPRIEEILSTVKPLMQRLFEGKKTAYSRADLNMKSNRLPEELLPAYEIAKKRCFLESEELVYITKMIKINRRGYEQRTRLLGITTERIYNIKKKYGYYKERVVFEDILGITCTPYQDGFICIHTKEKYEDRGDWLVVVEHPCEFITKMFTVLGRDNNDDSFLKIETKFTHGRRFYPEAIKTDDCRIEARLADSFRIKRAHFDQIIIYTP